MAPLCLKEGKALAVILLVTRNSFKSQATSHDLGKNVPLFGTSQNPISPCLLVPYFLTCSFYREKSPWWNSRVSAKSVKKPPDVPQEPRPNVGEHDEPAEGVPLDVLRHVRVVAPADVRVRVLHPLQ